MFYGEVVERVDLGLTYPSVRKVWRNGDAWAAKTEEIVLGRLPGGRWYVTSRARCVPWGSTPGCAYAGPNAEHYARNTARRWMRTVGGTWVEA